ncbi:M56 family metallopeptidase [Amycolatopsis nalaikhensis]|uniref:M48 family metalloprotease n=1 Tax=Amycolatopsis nalaikhensis TaxID=715472 RepID=A0ABY8XU54_9PSEU|nr:M48 family metalloprotease [Amycolatopsis sp. 2-2]WIV59220.1 M48 family metalloprotease [Amycolatopsis sp. 2-2]
MEFDVWVPLLLPLAAWPLARSVAPKLAPREASWLLTAGCLVLAAGSTLTLALQAFGGMTLIPAVARAGHWSPQVLRGQDPINIPVSIGCGVLLAGLAVTFVRTALGYTRWIRALTRELDEHSREPGVVILPGAEPVAFAAPGRGGRIAVSTGMLSALSPRERTALLAHERAHLRLRHHHFLVAVTLAATLNPLLRPLCAAARFSLERWADEAAARHVGDRTVVAHSVAKAALAGHSRPGFALAATGGPVPRRVTALLTTQRRRLPAALLAAALLFGTTAWSAVTSLDSMTDLHSTIESAQAEHQPG